MRVGFFFYFTLIALQRKTGLVTSAFTAKPQYPMSNDCLAMCRVSLLVVILFHALLQAADAGCPPGYESYNYACYRFGNSRVSLYEGYRICDGSEGYLVNIDAERENSFLIEKIKEQQTVYAGYWIGGTFSRSQSVWSWFKVDRNGHDSGKIMDFTNWGPQQPDPYGGNGNRFWSAILVNRIQDTYEWYSVAMDFTTSGRGMSYICEADWQEV